MNKDPYSLGERLYSYLRINNNSPATYYPFNSLVHMHEKWKVVPIEDSIFFFKNETKKQLYYDLFAMKKSLPGKGPAFIYETSKLEGLVTQNTTLVINNYLFASRPFLEQLLDLSWKQVEVFIYLPALPHENLFHVLHPWD